MISRKKSILANRVDETVEEAVVAFAVEKPPLSGVPVNCQDRDARPGSIMKIALIPDP